MTAPTYAEAVAALERLRGLAYMEKLPGDFTIFASFDDCGDGRPKARVRLMHPRMESRRDTPVPVVERFLAVRREVDWWERNEGPWPTPPESTS